MQFSNVQSVPPLDLKKQLSEIREGLLEAVTEVLDSTQYILGPKVLEFEQAIATYVGTKHAIGVSSGTDALLLALMTLEVGPGHRVITSDFSFFATAGTIARLGAQPVFVDIDSETFNLSPVHLKNTLEQMTSDERKSVKAIIPVHLYGQCADMTLILEAAQQFNIPIIEDAAQAIGAEYRTPSGIKCAGTMGNLGCYSFFPTKNLGGIGDSGMLVTNDDDLAQQARLKRVHGAGTEYIHEVIGGNFRIDPIQSAALSVKLPYLNTWHRARQAKAEHYKYLFKKYQLTQVVLPESVYQEKNLTHSHIYNQYMICAPQRDELLKYLNQKQIASRIYYPIPFHLQKCFQSLGYKIGHFPQAEKVANEILSLPIFPELTEEMQEYVVFSISEFYGRQAI